MFLGNDRYGIALQNITDGLLLRQYQPAFRRRFVNRHDQHNQITGSEQITYDAEAIILIRNSRGQRLPQLADPLLL
ncbi:hypothetical protein D3C81_1981030 [compost metagenome]